MTGLYRHYMDAIMSYIMNMTPAYIAGNTTHRLRKRKAIYWREPS